MHLVLTKNDIDELRIDADKAKMDGRFRAGQLLHELLDAYEDAEEHESKIESAEETASDLEDALSDIEDTAWKAGARAPRPDVEDMPELQLRAEVEKLREALDDIFDTVP